MAAAGRNSSLQKQNTQSHSFWWKVQNFALRGILDELCQCVFDVGVVQNIVHPVDRHVVPQHKLITVVSDGLGLGNVGRIGIIGEFIHEIGLVGRIVDHPVF